MERFDHITLEPEEAEECLRLGREAKHYRIEREKYNEKIRSQYTPPMITAEQMFKAYGDRLTLDGENSSIVLNLCYYFAKDSRFRGDQNKGILLYGGVGLGKSTLMDFFKKNPKASYRLISCREIESDFSSEGEKSVMACSYNLPVATNSDPFGHQEIGYCFDDLGTEANAKFYGKEKNVMAEIILNRYDNKLESRYTHITTNLSVQDIEKQYGSRVVDRMRQMFNIIEFAVGAKSRRV